MSRESSGQKARTGYAQKAWDGTGTGAQRARLNGGRPGALKPLSAHLFLGALTCFAWRPECANTAIGIGNPQAPGGFAMR